MRFPAASLPLLFLTWTIPAPAELAGWCSGTGRRDGDADSMLLLPYDPIVASLPPTAPPPTRL